MVIPTEMQAEKPKILILHYYQQSGLQNRFKNPIEYARHVASLANLISGGSVLVQRLGDLENGRRTDEKG